MCIMFSTMLIWITFFYTTVTTLKMAVVYATCSTMVGYGLFFNISTQRLTMLGHLSGILSEKNNSMGKYMLFLSSEK
jgi:hypothetical protein